ncbi:hypothetical protein HanRHA438_Chr05g0212361 [Helianthus annuus]|nr:hypothetical protein HanRHA438_Chr05g0212361 [Helianthus annuus]
MFKSFFPFMFFYEGRPLEGCLLTKPMGNEPSLKRTFYPPYWILALEKKKGKTLQMMNTKT